CRYAGTGLSPWRPAAPQPMRRGSRCDMNRQSLIAVAALALASCATVPTPLRGDFPALTPREAVEQGATAQRVRWGGEIIEVQPKASTTCFEVLARELDWNARPMLR